MKLAKDLSNSNRNAGQTSKQSGSLRLLEKDKRPATTEEKSMLVKYVGWGGIPQVFDRKWRYLPRERASVRQRLSVYLEVAS